jgi:transcriptional regulator with GAF, ATPase, and Fis domain
MVSMNQRTVILLRVGEMARELRQRETGHADDVLDELTQNATRFVPGAQHAGLSLVGRHGSIETVAYTHKYAVMLDDIQRRRREGPGLAAWEHQVIRIDDLADEQRWPKYRRDAIAATAVRSILSLQLFADLKHMGALNLYAESPNVFDDESVQLGVIFATHTALAWNIVRRDEQFKNALASRDIIGQAKGMIMERFNIDATQAFELLKRLSQTSNAPVAEVARGLVHADHPPR